MELQKCGDTKDHSIEMEAALKRFENVCNTLEDEHAKLLALEKRRQQLNDDLERLRREIKTEKKYFRSMIDEQIMVDSESSNQKYGNEQLLELADPMTLDTGAIKEFIENERDELVAYGKEAEGDFKQCKVDYIQRKPEEIVGNLDNNQMDIAMTCAKNAEIDLDKEKCNNY